MTVGELTRQIKSMLEGRFDRVWVEGEISNFKSHTSGHWYFSLKDASASLSAAMFRGSNRNVRFDVD
jgi:exodeoxyribonuclease VII large subunit